MDDRRSIDGQLTDGRAGGRRNQKAAQRSPVQKNMFASLSSFFFDSLSKKKTLFLQHAWIRSGEGRVFRVLARGALGGRWLDWLRVMVVSRLLDWLAGVADGPQLMRGRPNKSLSTSA